MTNSSRLSVFCDKIIEAGWLAAVVLAPLFFNIYSSRVFEPDKITLLRSVALIMIAAWIVRTIEEFTGRARNKAGAPESGGGKGWLLHSVTWRTPLVLPTLALVVVYLIATAFSITPRTSLLGSYQRLQGTYTTFSYIVVFLMILMNMRQRRQLDRLVTAIVVTSLPIAFYGILQRVDRDPLPWGGDVTQRIAANMGNAIFIAAYLIMAFFLTLGRTIEAFRVILTEEESRLSDILRASAYIFVGAVQLLAFAFAGSRGPLLGWLPGMFILGLVGLLLLRVALHGSEATHANEDATIVPRPTVRAMLTKVLSTHGLIVIRILIVVAITLVTLSAMSGTADLVRLGVTALTSGLSGLLILILSMGRAELGRLIGSGVIAGLEYFAYRYLVNSGLSLLIITLFAALSLPLELLLAFASVSIGVFGLILLVILNRLRRQAEGNVLAATETYVAVELFIDRLLAASMVGGIVAVLFIVAGAGASVSVTFALLSLGLFGVALLATTTRKDEAISRRTKDMSWVDVLKALEMSIYSLIVAGGAGLLALALAAGAFPGQLQVELATVAALIGGLVPLLVFAGVQRTAARWLWLSWIFFSVIGAFSLFLVNFSDQPQVVEQRDSGAFGSLGTLFESEGGTGRVRTLIWEGAVNLVRAHEPITFPDGATDPFNGVRTLIGYGPESMYVAYNRFYPPELAHYEARNASPDRSHNETWDSLVITGAIGFLAEQFLFLSVFFFALKFIGWVPNRKAIITLIAMMIIGGALGAGALRVVKDESFMGTGWPGGVTAGIVLYVITFALFHFRISTGVYAFVAAILIAILDATLFSATLTSPIGPAAILLATGAGIIGLGLLYFIGRWAFASQTSRYAYLFMAFALVSAAVLTALLAVSASPTGVSEVLLLAIDFVIIAIYFIAMWAFGSRISKPIYLLAGAVLTALAELAILGPRLTSLELALAILAVVRVGAIGAYFAIYFIKRWTSGERDTAGQPITVSGHIFLIIALFGGMLAHYLEISLAGIAIVATRTYFWTYAAMLVVAGLNWVPADEAEAAPIPAARPAPATAGKPLTPAAPRGKKRKAAPPAPRPEQRSSPTRAAPPWVGSTIAMALIGAMVLSTLGFDFINTPPIAEPSQLPRDAMEVLRNSLTRLPYKDNAQSIGVLLMFFVTWLFGAVVSLTELRRRNIITPANQWRAAGLYAGVSIAFSLTYWIFHASGLLNVIGTLFRLNAGPAASIDEYMGRFIAVAEGMAGLLALFYVMVFSAMIFIALSLYSEARARALPLASEWGLIAGVPIAVAALAMVFAFNYNSIRADIIYKQGAPYVANNACDGAGTPVSQCDIAIAHLKQALRHAPDEDFYMLALGASFLNKSAASTDEGSPLLIESSTYDSVFNLDAERTSQLNRRDALTAARVTLERARQVNPLNTDHSANLARLHRRWSDLAGSTDERRLRLDQSSGFYEQATNLSPNNAQLWNEWALVHFVLYEVASQLGDAAAAQAALDEAGNKLDRSLALDQEFADTYYYLASLYTVRNEPEKAQVALEQALRLNPSNPEAWQRLIDQLIPNGNYTEAETLTVEFVSRNPTFLPGWRTLAQRIYLPQGRLAEAASATQRALELSGQDPEHWLDQAAMAQIFLLAGDPAAALPYAQAAVQLAPPERLADAQAILDAVQAALSGSSQSPLP